MIDLLLKKMGINPESLHAQSQVVLAQVNATILHFNKRLDRIEARQLRILELLGDKEVVAHEPPKQTVLLNNVPNTAN